MSDRLEGTGKQETGKEGTEKPETGKQGTVSQWLLGLGIAFVVFCLVIMLVCCLEFVFSSLNFSKVTEAALTTVANETPEHQEAVEKMLGHIERMIEIQKNGMTNDLMSFVYGILSTILVGLCASFVLKSGENAEKAKEKAVEMEIALLRSKEDAKKAQDSAAEAKDKAENVAKSAKQTEEAMTKARSDAKEAKTSAEEAKEQAALVAKSAKQTEEAMTKARSDAEEAKTSAEEAKKQAELVAKSAKQTEEAIRTARADAEEAKRSAKEAEERAEKINELQYRIRLMVLINKIVSAKFALLDVNPVWANREISQINKEVHSLFSDDGFVFCKAVFGQGETQQVYDELMKLSDRVEEFKERAQKKEQTDLGTKSIEASVMNYNKWIKEAIDCIDIARRKARDAEIAREG